MAHVAIEPSSRSGQSRKDTSGAWNRASALLSAKKRAISARPLTSPANRRGRGPRRLLIVATANIRNDELISLVDQHLVAIVAALSEARFVELGLDQLIVHDDH